MKSKINDEINKVKKELYLKASAEYFDRCGYKKFKISELAKELETSVGTLYNIFNSKEDLYLEYLILKLETFLENLKSNETNDPVKNLELYLKSKYEIFIQIDNTTNYTLTNDPYFFHKLDVLNHPIVQDIYNYLIRQFKQIMPDSKVDYMHISILFKKFSDGFIESYLQEKYNKENIINDTIELFFNGMNSKRD